MTDATFKTTRTVSDLSELTRLGQDVAKTLRPGDVITLNGPLGAGKTTLVQAVGEAIGLEQRAVSPTFVLIHEYRGGKLPVVHADLYRLEEKAHTLSDELMAIIDEGKAVLFVEWACYGEFLKPYVTLHIDIALDTDSEQRLITLSSRSKDRLVGLQ